MAKNGILWIYCCILINFTTAAVLKDEVCSLPQDMIDDIASYQDVVYEILGYFRGEFKGQTFKMISDFSDKFGPRLTGSEVLEQSIDYMHEQSLQNDLDNVHTESLEVPYWFRNVESAYIIKPRPRKIKMLGIGFSPPTPEEGIQAPAVVVESFDELKSLTDDQVKGKIVVFDQKFTTYGETVRYRNYASSEVSLRGGLAVLIRSVTQFSLATPHTGDQIYYDDVEHIPAAAITHEDADYLRREQNRGHEIELKLTMLPILETRQSRNLIADLTGSTQPERKVIVAGHIDSWDVGDGSMDDTGGSFISWVAPIALKNLNLIPKRTVRSIMFTGEEQGLFGAIDYEAKHESDEDNLVFLMESDTGTFAPKGLNYQGSDVGECMMREILKLFTSINADELVLRSPAPDISIWTDRGFPGAGLHNANERYFWFHHSEGDRLNVLESDNMDLNGGFWTAVAYIIADMKYEVPKNAANGLDFVFINLICSVIYFILH